MKTTKKLHLALIEVKKEVKILKRVYLSWDKLFLNYKVSFINPELMGKRFELIKMFQIINGELK